MPRPAQKIVMISPVFKTLVLLGAVVVSSSAYADLTIRIGESTPGSATFNEGDGGQAVIGVFASSDGTAPDTFDSFDLFVDLLGDGAGVSALQGFTFAAAPVVPGAVFTNAAVNPSSMAISPLANADLQVSADRAPFQFGTTETKLFDLFIDVNAAVPAGTFAVQFRDDSGFGLQAINNAGENLLLSQPGAITLLPGVITINVAAVPEPSSLSLLAFASVGMIVRRRRK